MLILTKGVYRSTPTKSMELLLNYPPLHLLLEEEASKAFVRVHDKIKLIWDGIGQGTKRGSLLILKNESKAITDSLPFLEDESKRLNYFKPYTFDPDPPDDTYMKGRCHIINYKHQWTAMWSLECQKQLISYNTMNFIATKTITLQLSTLRELIDEIKSRKIAKIGITIDKDLFWALNRILISY